MPNRTTSTISVVMATYNGGRYLREQLDTLVRQDELPLEIIISDDSSTDDTVTIAEKFRATSPVPVRIGVNSTRLGYRENFLGAAKLARGTYVAFCDQDDLWYPAKLRTARDALDRTGADLFVHAADVVDDRGTRISVFTQGIRGTARLDPFSFGPWSVFYGCTMVFPRALLELFDPAERGAHTFEHQGTLSHDLWVHFLANSLGGVVTSEESLIAYRRHAGNVTPTVIGRGVRAWVRSLGVPAHPDLPRAAIAERRAELMAGLTTTGADATLRARARAAVAYWKAVSEHETARSEAYARPRLTARAAGVLALARRGGYRSFSARGGLGPRLLLKDVLAGVLLPRSVRRAQRTV